MVGVEPRSRRGKRTRVFKTLLTKEQQNFSRILLPTPAFITIHHPIQCNRYFFLRCVIRVAASDWRGFADRLQRQCGDHLSGVARAGFLTVAQVRCHGRSSQRRRPDGDSKRAKSGRPITFSSGIRQGMGGTASVPSDSFSFFSFDRGKNGTGQSQSLPLVSRFKCAFVRQTFRPLDQTISG
jgi:hypothetical protein